MNVLTAKKRFSHYLMMILTIAILSACSISPSSKNTPPALFSELSNNSAFFLKQAELVSGVDSVNWQFVALQALIAEQQFILAEPIIEYLQSLALSETQKNALTLLIADNFYAQDKLDEAQLTLNKIDNKQLSKNGLIYFLKLQTQLHIDNEAHLAASHNLLLLTPLLTLDSEIQHYHDLLLAQLSLLPIDFLNQFQSKPEVTEEITAEEQVISAEVSQTVDSEQQIKQGWYALASLYQRYQLRPNQLIRSVENWKTLYPEHPALNFMPTQLTNLSALSPYQPENIAVLIPLSGRFKQQGQAIQYGLLHAFYKEQQAKENAPEEVVAPPTARLHFYDTQSQNMEQILAQFEEQNVDFVIGPLLKSNVEKFLPLAANIPVLALNSFPIKPQEDDQTTTEKNIAWHYAFPLSPEEEAKQAAQFIFSKQHKKPLLIAPNSAYGKRIAQAFSTQWSALNTDSDSPIETHYFNNKDKLATFIASTLQTDKSKIRSTQMKVMTGLPLETELRSRRDIDAIYLISKRDQLLMLKSFIDVSISPFAASIPLYASSRSHQFETMSKQNKELSELVFSDSPFLLNTTSEVFTEVQRAWSNQSIGILRLFALGFDSYQLIEQLMLLQNNENNSYKGLIGELSLHASNTIQAKLNWAKYQQGKLIEIAAPVSAE